MNDKIIPLSEQYRINIKNAIELIDNTLELVKKSNVILSSKHLKEIRKAIAKKPYQNYEHVIHLLCVAFSYFSFIDNTIIVKTIAARLTPIM